MLLINNGHQLLDTPLQKKDISTFVIFFFFAVLLRLITDLA